MANKRISFDEEAPKISEPLVRVSDDFVAPYAEPVARPQDDPLVRMGQALSGLSSSLELYAKATEPERIEADKTAFREWEELTPEQQQAAVEEGAYKARQFEYIWKQEGANAAKEYERQVNLRFAEATDWTKPEQSSAIVDEERAAMLENLPEHLKDNAIFLNQFDESSREFRERFKTRASAKAEERRVADGLLVAETGLVDGIGNLLEASDGTDPEALQVNLEKAITDSMNTIYGVYGSDLGPGEQQKIMNRVFITVVDQLADRKWLEDLEELKTFMETLEESKPTGFTGFSTKAMSKIDSAIIEVEEWRDRQDGKNELDDVLKNATTQASGILSGAKATYAESGTVVDRDWFKAQVNAELKDKFPQNVKDQIATEAFLAFEAYKSTRDAQESSATRQDKLERDARSGEISAQVVQYVELHGLEAGLNYLKEHENEMTPKIYAQTEATLIKMAESSKVVTNATNSFRGYDSDSSKALEKSLYDAVENGDEITADMARSDIQELYRTKDAIIEEAVKEHFTPVYNKEEGTWSIPGEEGLEDKIKDALEEKFAPLLEQFEAEARTVKAEDPTEVGALIDTGAEGLPSDADPSVGWLQKSKDQYISDPTQENLDQLKADAGNLLSRWQTGATKRGILLGPQKPSGRDRSVELATNAVYMEYGRIGADGQFEYGEGYLTQEGDRDFVFTQGNLKNNRVDQVELGMGSPYRVLVTQPFKKDEEKTEQVMNQFVDAARITGLKVAPKEDEDQAAVEEGGAFVKDGRVFMPMGKDGDTPVFVRIGDAQARVLTDPSKTVMLPVGTTKEEVEAMLTLAEDDYEAWLETDMGQFYSAYLKQRKGFQRGETFGPEQFIGVATQLSTRLGSLDTSGLKVSRQAPVPIPPR